MKYMAILYHQNGRPVPLMEDDLFVARLFDTEGEARVAINATLFGEHFGGEIIPWPEPSR